MVRIANGNLVVEGPRHPPDVKAIFENLQMGTGKRLFHVPVAEVDAGSDMTTIRAKSTALNRSEVEKIMHSTERI